MRGVLVAAAAPAAAAASVPEQFAAFQAMFGKSYGSGADESARGLPPLPRARRGHDSHKVNEEVCWLTLKYSV